MISSSEQFDGLVGKILSFKPKAKDENSRKRATKNRPKGRFLQGINFHYIPTHYPG
uniref:Uncharacterized protein n=1 Tax=Candidatus Kentrum sp. LFY TaxID=2126342 RepID=A0A450U925_9GAMM|nr:MAG: hypothetical protein BECKLFY1418A_GA0070994_100456 [Candidatus Kentron sp. LFY]